ncbi:MAG: MFS transporter [Holosporaceae bacterium]|jgi:predicted MFS family arabinose efflux permease|nr:MFS transporter [Holosporaceae bacterium]
MSRFFEKNNLIVIAVSMLFLGMSTRMLYSHLALYLKFELHASLIQISLIEGCVEFLSYLVRVLFGLISDYFFTRKIWILSGCAVVLLIKPFFVLLNGVGEIMCAAFVDRFGTGMQICPRDALTAECSAKNQYSTAFGFVKSLKTIGSIVGVMLAVAIMYFSGENYRMLFLCSTVPALLSLLAVTAIRPDKSTTKTTLQMNNQKNPRQRIGVFLTSLRHFNRDFFILLISAGICRMGFFGESLLVLRASDITFNNFAALTTLFVGVGQIIFAYPMGIWADKTNKTHIIGISLVISIVAHISMMLCDNIYTLFVGIFFSSGQQAVIQTLFLSIISSNVGNDLRATAFGIFHCTMGAAYLIGTGVCGLLCEGWGYAGAFLYCIIVNCYGLLLCKQIRQVSEHAGAV